MSLMASNTLASGAIVHNADVLEYMTELTGWLVFIGMIVRAFIRLFRETCK